MSSAMSRKLLLHGSPYSQPSRAVEILLRKLQIPYALNTVPVLKGGCRTPEFRQLNPNEQIPVIDDNGFVLYESHAILRYLVNKYDPSNDVYPTNVEERALCDQYLDWHNTRLRQAAHGFYMNRVILKELFSKDVKEEKLVVQKRKLGKTLDMLEQWLSERRYIAGGKPTLADISSSCELAQLWYAPKDFDIVDVDRFPKINSWISRIKEENAPHFEDIHKPFVKFFIERQQRKKQEREAIQNG